MHNWYRLMNMRFAVCLLAFLSCASAIPSHNFEIDWSKVKHIESFVEPLPNAQPDASPRITGGSDAERNSLPYTVALLFDGTSFCGGSLISRLWILSAAHCTIGASFVQVILGAHNVRSHEASQITFTSRSIRNHPNFNRETLNHDISLIELPDQTILTQAVQVIPLAPANAGSFAGSTGVLSGWGRLTDDSDDISPILQTANLNIITNAVCQNTYGSRIQSSMLCTSGAGSIGACDGDSGSPLIVGELQVGVVSFGSTQGCQAGHPTAYIRVSSERRWINSVADV